MTQRIDWSDLPEAVRDAVGQQCGGIKAVSPISVGVNNAVACTLDAGDGALFFKGLRTSDPHLWMYRNEIAAAASGSPGPRLRWSLEVEDWMFVCFDYVEGRHADLAPGSPDLELIAEKLQHLAEQPPLSNEVHFAAESSRWEQMRPWNALAARAPENLDPWVQVRLHDFAENEPKALLSLDGDHLAHTDLHELNILITTSDAHLIDWAWARRAAPWVDAEMFTLRLVTAGHSCALADDWRLAHLPFAELDTDTRRVFAAEMLGTWLYLAVVKPRRTFLAEMADHALRWAKYLCQAPSS